MKASHHTPIKMSRATYTLKELSNPLHAVVFWLILVHLRG